MGCRDGDTPSLGGERSCAGLQQQVQMDCQAQASATPSLPAAPKVSPAPAAPHPGRVPNCHRGDGTARPSPAPRAAPMVILAMFFIAKKEKGRKGGRAGKPLSDGPAAPGPGGGGRRGNPGVPSAHPNPLDLPAALPVALK